MHSNSILLFKTYVRPHINPHVRLLEIGPDAFPSTYQKIVNDASVMWETIDISNHPQLTYPRVNENKFPIPDNTYDVVLAGQVMEHVPKIWDWIQELDRILKPGGRIVLITPISWPFHEAPVDCWRIYPDGMKALMERTRLKIEVCRNESLESLGYKRYLPGRSAEQQPKLLRWWNRLAGYVGYPVERAYDLLTIAKKS